MQRSASFNLAQPAGRPPPASAPARLALCHWRWRDQPGRPGPAVNGPAGAACDRGLTVTLIVMPWSRSSGPGTTRRGNVLPPVLAACDRVISRRARPGRRRAAKTISENSPTAPLRAERARRRLTVTQPVGLGLGAAVTRSGRRHRAAPGTGRPHCQGREPLAPAASARARERGTVRASSWTQCQGRAACGGHCSVRPPNDDAPAPENELPAGPTQVNFPSLQCAA